MAAALPLRPSVGFCLQADSTGNPPARWFVNMVKHKMVEMPISYSGLKVSRDWILSHGIGNLQVPFDIGSFRKLKERSEGARQATYCIDVVFNPLIIQLFMDDEFCNLMETYRPFVMNLALKRIEESIGIKLSSQSMKLVKSLRYKDGEDGDSAVPREFAELPDDTGSFDAEMPKQKVKEEPPEPLIEDISPGQRKPSAIKKGFFNNPNSKELYGPEGSKEGVLPENAGDPMGWMPKKLRNTCKIVDCNNPEYQEYNQKKESADKQNKMTSEFRDSILKDLEKWSGNKRREDQWEADLPDGAERPTPELGKYDNDYSRFSRVEDITDEPAKDDRDWYYDHNGNRRQIETSAATASSSSQATEAAVKKGFFENTKKPLYAEPSREGSVKAALNGKNSLDERALLAEFEKLPPEEKALMEEFKTMLAQSSDLKTPERSKHQVSAKAPERISPKYSLTEASAGLLQLIIDVPGLQSMTGVDLDVTERQASLVFPSTVGLKPLKVELPTNVVPSSVRAKFSKKTQQITVSLPTVTVA